MCDSPTGWSPDYPTNHVEVLLSHSITASVNESVFQSLQQTWIYVRHTVFLYTDFTISKNETKATKWLGCFV